MAINSIVGAGILTTAGLQHLADAIANNTTIQPTKFRVSDEDIELSPNLTAGDVNWWRVQDIDVSHKIDEDNAEFVCIIAPENMTNWAKLYGLFLDDGTLFMVVKPPYPLPPSIKMTERIRLQYANSGDALVYVSGYDAEWGSFKSFEDISGSANSIVLDGTVGIESLLDGMAFVFSPKYISTGATTLKTQSLDAKPLFHKGAELEAGYLDPLSKYIAIYDLSNDRFDCDLLTSSKTITYSDVNPTPKTNPSTKEVLWVNTTSGEVFTCTDNTTDLNYWVGQLGTLIIPDLRVTIPVTTVAEWKDFFNLENPKAITYTAGLGFDNFQSADTWKSDKVKFLEEFSCNITTTVDDAGMDALSLYVFYKDGSYLQLVIAYDAWDGGNTDRRLMINGVTIYTSAVAEDHRAINFVIDNANATKEIDYIEYDGSQNGANSQNVHNYIDDIQFIKATLW